MTHLTPRFAAAAAAALLALGACSTEPETVEYGGIDPQAEALNQAAPVEAPPMIQANRTYRCKDNSLLYVDFFTNDTARAHRGDRHADPPHRGRRRRLHRRGLVGQRQRTADHRHRARQGHAELHGLTVAP